MFEPPYRAAVIGRTGRGDYGHGLDLAFRDEPRFELVAVADDNPDGRAAAATRLGVDRTYADYREMLAKERPPFVAVAPRWIDAHRDMILACAEAGVRGILCEKPLAPTVADCDAIVEACARHHVQLAMAYQTRYSPRFEQVLALVAAGALGELLELRGRGKEDRRGGGEDLMVLGAHVMNLANAVLGEPSWCSARVTEGGRPVEAPQVREGAEGLGWLAGDRIDAAYGFSRSPAVFHFASDRAPHGAGRRFGLALYGSKGVIVMGTGWKPEAAWLDDPAWIPTGSSRWVEITSAGVGQPETIPTNDLAAGNRAIVADLIRAVETDAPPRADVRAGRTAIEMILGVYASHVAGHPVELPLAQRDVHPLEQLRKAAP